MTVATEPGRPKDYLFPKANQVFVRIKVQHKKIGSFNISVVIRNGNRQQLFLTTGSLKVVKP